MEAYLRTDRDQEDGKLNLLPEHSQTVQDHWANCRHLLDKKIDNFYPSKKKKKKKNDTKLQLMLHTTYIATTPQEKTKDKTQIITLIPAGKYAPVTFASTNSI